MGNGGRRHLQDIVGRAASILWVFEIAPFLRGTLKSTRATTRCPDRGTWSIESFLKLIFFVDKKRAKDEKRIVVQI